MTRASIPVVSLVMACGGAPAVTTKPEPPKPQPIQSLAQLEGEWQAQDIDGWYYDLSLRGGTFAQTIRKGAGGTCTQKGKLETFEKMYGQPYMSPEQQRWMYQEGGASYGGAPPGPPPGTVLALVLTLDENTCNPDFYQGMQLVVLVQDFHTLDFTMRLGVGFGGAEESHRYESHVPPPSRAKE
jgi:hypothetical protein